mgnify:CR=1 FL=1
MADQGNIFQRLGSLFTNFEVENLNDYIKKIIPMMLAEIDDTSVGGMQ